MRMIRTIFVLVFLASSQQVMSQWVTCDTCTTPTHFGNAAKSHVANVLGVAEVYVGNSVTGRIQIVETWTRREGDILEGLPPEVAKSPVAAAIAAAGANVKMADPTLSEVFIVDILSNNRASAESEVQFMDAVDAFKTTALEVLPENSLYDSFSGRNHAALFNHFREQSWISTFETGVLNNLPAATLEAMYNALSSAVGHPPTKCAVFNNGDYACFEFILSSFSLRYKKGTATTADNVPITSEDGGTPHGGAPHGVGSSGQHTAYGPVYGGDSGGTYWQIVVRDGEGNIIETYIVYVQP